MQLISVGSGTDEKRAAFFQAVLGSTTGYLAIALKHGRTFGEQFFEWPDHLDSILSHINKYYPNNDIYFCPQTFAMPRRTKSTVSGVQCLWADLDDSDPKAIKPAPSVVVRTSPGRTQAFWLLDEPPLPADAEDVSRRLAYNYGGDTSGWDLTQLLRVPWTYNLKYAHPSAPIVEVEVQNYDKRYSLKSFEKIPEVPGLNATDFPPFPHDLSVADPDVALRRWRANVDPRALTLYSNPPPDEDWSAALWALEMLLLEAGLPREDVFVICKHAACNKFARDNRPDEYLWRDVCRASAKYEGVGDYSPQALPDLLTESEVKTVSALEPTFVDRYVEWAKTRGDAAWQYHEAGAFVILSALLSGVVKLPTRIGTIVPNVWFMLLGTTTLTRKSTAMDSAMDLLLQVDNDAILATDGSIEGLLTAISNRPNRPSVFWRDEISGLLDAIKKRDYYAGMTEALARLYDAKFQKRILRRETIELRDPIVITFCGGVKDRVLDAVDVDFVISGLGPRFVFISAESDVQNYRPLGPMSFEQDATQEVLVKELHDLVGRYAYTTTMRINTITINSKPAWEAKLTPEAWDRYNEFEFKMVSSVNEHPSRDLLVPAFDRLSKSALKCAVLIAASRQEPPVTVEVSDMLKAISYADRWRHDSLTIIANVGRGASERKLGAVHAQIQRAGSKGILRGEIMRHHHLTSKDADWILETLEQRGMIRRDKRGAKKETLYPTVIR